MTRSAGNSKRTERFGPFAGVLRGSTPYLFRKGPRQLVVLSCRNRNWKNQSEFEPTAILSSEAANRIIPSS